jgi:hypothetical protein
MSWLQSKSKGVSSVLSATMFVAILLVSFGLVVWNGQIYSSYLGAINSKENSYDQTSAEEVSVTAFYINQNKLNLTITNDSPNIVRIVRMWVSNLSVPAGSPLWRRTFDMNVMVKPGLYVMNVGRTLGTFYSSELYTVKLVTDRGNAFGATNYGKTTKVGIAQGTGWISLDWDSYKFNNINNLNLRPAWNLSKSGLGNVVQFQIAVINHWDKNLTVMKYTYLKMDRSTTSGSTMNFFLMDPSSQPNNVMCYDPVLRPIVLQPNKTGDFETGGTPVTLKFLGSDWKSGQCSSSPALQTDRFQVYLVIFIKYQIGVTWYYMAQTIPFEGTNISA